MMMKKNYLMENSPKILSLFIFAAQFPGWLLVAILRNCVNFVEPTLGRYHINKHNIFSGQEEGGAVPLFSFYNVDKTMHFNLLIWCCCCCVCARTRYKKH